VKPSTHVNIDGDVICYAVGFASQSSWYVVDGKRFEKKADAHSYVERYCLPVDDVVVEIEPEPIAHCLSSVKRLIQRIIKSSKAHTATILLTGSGNFREEIAMIQKYKGNRTDNTKPVHYQAIWDYLIMVHGAEVCEGEEADDQLSIRAVTKGDTIATVDKDLNNTAGWHYNWQRDELYHVNEVEADRNFYTQLLTGDATDHIPGLKRITGKMASASKKAPIQEMTDPRAMYVHVKNVYMDAAKDDDQSYNNDGMRQLEIDADITLTEIGRLLWMRREENELWLPPSK